MSALPSIERCFGLFRKSLSLYIYTYNCWSISCTMSHTLSEMPLPAWQEKKTEPVLTGGETLAARQSKIIAL